MPLSVFLHQVGGKIETENLNGKKEGEEGCKPLKYSIKPHTD